MTQTGNPLSAPRPVRRYSIADLTQAVNRLREALLGLAERDLLDDPLPCYCVQYEQAGDPHDEWCEAARSALADTSDESIWSTAGSSTPTISADIDPLAAARARGDQARRDILASQGDMLEASDVAARLAIEVAEVEHRRQDGRLIALPTESGRLGFPAWQFTEQGLMPGLEEVFRDMVVHSPWMRAQFFLTGDLRLNGQRPLEALRRGEVEAVRRAGAAYGEQLAS